MNSKSIISLLFAAALPLLLLACDFGSNNPTQVNTKIDLKNGQALYGVWEKLDLEFKENRAWILLFTDTGAYFISEQFKNGDSLGADGGALSVCKSKWSVDSNTITFQSNPYLLLNLSKVWPYFGIAQSEAVGDTGLPVQSVDGFSFVANTFTNWDTLSWVYGLYRFSFPIDSNSRQAYYVLKAPYEFTVLNIQTTKGGDQQLHITDRACYDRNKNAASIDSVCEVSVFTKHVRPYYADILKHVDTVSSTYVLKQNGGLSLQDSIIWIERGQEGTSLRSSF